MRKRVAILESELVSAYGFGKDKSIAGLYSGKDAFSKITRFSTEQFTCHKAGIVPGLTEPSEMLDFCAEKVLNLPENTPVLIASTIGEIDKLYQAERCTLNTLLETVLTRFRKRNGRIVSAACASTNAAIDRARRMILAEMCDTVIVAAYDFVSEFAFSGFVSIGAMTDDTARPYDKNRSGLILGEAAGVLVLASEEQARGKQVQAWISGSGMSGDALHITAPQTDGIQLGNAIRSALTEFQAEELSCVLGHGTGTVYNDIMELNAIRNIFGDEIPLASAKGGCGHTLGVCGMLQAVLAVEILQRKMLFPQIGLETPEAGAEKMVSTTEQRVSGNSVLSLNSGFGGINTAILLEGAI